MTAPATELSTIGEGSVSQFHLERKGPSLEEALHHPFTAEKRHGKTVLMADDDFDDCLLAREAWDDLKTDHLLRFVHDGQEVLDYIYHQGPHQDHLASPSPALILLDLNMPKKNGLEVLAALKGDPRTRTIPIIVFTTTKNVHHILQTYNDGANAFMSKPTSYEGYVNTLRTIECFWLTLVELPVIQS